MSLVTTVPGLLARWYAILLPPKPTKSSSAIRIGLLGASTIAPIAVINPAKSHPEVIIAAVAARDPARAQAYAKRHGIPVIHDSYDALLADEAIDAVYIPLPNGLHYEWTIKALKANKHVLLEKPSTSNAAEAELLFDFYDNLGPTKPVLLEAFHYRFHPAFNFFKALVNQRASEGAKIKNVLAHAQLPKGLVAHDDIRFKYDLAGGALMDLGTYVVSCVRNILDTEPLECISVKQTLLPEPLSSQEPKIDTATTARLRFPGGITADIHADLTGPRLELAKIVARVEFEAQQHNGKVVRRSVQMANFMLPFIWHSIVEEIEIDGVTTINTYKAYDWKEAEKQIPGLSIPGSAALGEIWWSTYRNQLEQFVNRVKRRPDNGLWIDREQSINQMAAIDLIYAKGDLGLRPMSSYRG